MAANLAAFNRIPLAVLLLIPLLLGSCKQAIDCAPGCVAPDTRTTMAGEAVRLSAEDAGTGVQLMVGQALRVELDTSPASGYAWELEGDLPPGLRVETDPGTGPLQSKMAGPAGGSQQIWNFRATQPGRVRLHFLYRRAWERADQAARRAVFDVGVHSQL